MGCDIHAFVEVKKPDGTWTDASDNWYGEGRCYGVFSFLTGGQVRNYSGIYSPFEVRGVPDDVSPYVREQIDEQEGNGHSHSWLTVKELMEFNYEAIMEDRRYTAEVSKNHFYGVATCEPGEGTKQTWRDFLGEYYFDELKRAEQMGEEVRLVFFFDN